MRNYGKYSTISRWILVWFFLFSLTSCSKKVAESPIKNVNKNFHFLQQGDTRLHYVSVGSKYHPPVLFIHGAPDNWTAYDNLMANKVLQSDFHLISVDRLGYGLSRKGKTRLASIEEQADAIVNALHSNLSGQKAILIGRSYGAPIAAKIAATYPEKVEKLILISPVIDPEREKYFWFAYAAKHWLVREFLPDDINTATDEKFAHAAELRKMEKDWEKITTEVAVFTGEKDWIADVRNYDYAKKKLAKLPKKYQRSFVLLPDAGHAISETHPDQVLAEILPRGLAKGVKQ